MWSSGKTNVFCDERVWITVKHVEVICVTHKVPVRKLVKLFVVVMCKIPTKD